MEEDAVRAYVERAKSVIDESPQMDEANTKAALLRDFLDTLGWEIPANTQLEYSVEAFGKTYKVDYALVLEGTPVAFLEAKGVDTSLTEKHREQLAAYLKNEDVNLGILTNGKEYEFFRRQVVDSKVRINELATVPLRDLTERSSILEAFTRGAIQTDEWVKILDRITELQRARTQLANDKETVATEIVSAVTDEVSDAISAQVESEAKEMIDRLIESIETEIDADKPAQHLPSEDAARTSDISESVPNGYFVEVLNGDETLATFVSDNQSDVMAECVDYLIENHDLVDRISPLPYVPGRNKAIINSEPTSPHDPEAMRNSRALTGGYFLDTHMNKRRKRRVLERLAEKCGLAVEFDGSW